MCRNSMYVAFWLLNDSVGENERVRNERWKSHVEFVNEKLVNEIDSFWYLYCSRMFM